MRTRFVGIVATIALLAGTAPPRVAAGQPQPDEIAPVPVGLVVLVDESGSLGDADVEAERAATALIAQSEFAVDSRVAVLGFGGRNGRPGQQAVRVVCPPIAVAAGPDRDHLARCAGGLHRRSTEEGNDTDFPSAIREGLATLDGMTGVKAKIAFVLTDGILNVDNDPAYGPDAEAREAAARDQIGRLLEQASAGGVAIWPLGFGDARKDELDSFAAGGSQRTCGPGSPKPQARKVESTEQVVQSLAEAFASARCARSTTPSAAPLPPGGTAELPVDVPAIASDGSIAVHKADPAIRVEYRDPDGRVVPKTGPLDESRFEISGESSPVEVLRVRNPRPGRWHVKLTAPPGVGGRTVSAIVIWQGVVHSEITVTPGPFRAGQGATVDLFLRTRRGLLADPAVLREITAEARVSGEGFEPINVRLQLGEHGRFTGSFTIPGSATGAFEVLGMIGGPGIANDERPWGGGVTLESAEVRTQIRFDHRLVEPGAALDGAIAVSNDSASPRRVRLELSGLDSGVRPTMSPGSAELAAAGPTSIPFTLSFDKATRLGFGLARLRVIDEADQERVYGEGLLTFEVGYPPPPPSFVERYLWLLLLLAAVVALAAGAGVLSLLRKRSERDVRGLQARLYRDGRQLAYLPAPDERSPRFGFVVRDAYGEPRLDHAPDGPDGYVARRGEGGTILLRTPEGTDVALRSGERTELPGGLELAVVDPRFGAGRSGEDDAVPVGPKPGPTDDDLL